MDDRVLPPRRLARLGRLAVAAGTAAAILGWAPSAMADTRAKVVTSQAGAVGASSSSSGFWLLDAAGGVTASGQTPFGSSSAGQTGSAAVAMAPTGDGGGYWVAHADATVTAVGDATVEPPAPPPRLNRPVVGMAPTPDGRGYWLVASDGGVFTFGDAGFYGSTGAMRLNKPIIGMAATPDGKGYWLVASDGGVFTFGDARFFGSAGGYSLEHPAVGMAATPDGGGYWLVTSAGQVFAYGDAGRYGDALSGAALATPAVGIAATSDGGGYWLATAGGQVLGFGDAELSAPPAAASAQAGTAQAGVASTGTAQAGVASTGTTATSDPGPSVSYTASGPVPIVAIADPGPPPAAFRVVQFALAQVGKPYVYGGTGPDGYDCSGLVMTAYGSVGIDLPRVAQDQYDLGPLLPAGAPLEPGDVVFFGAPGAISHDGIYIGNGMMVDAPHPGTDVRVESYQWSDYVGASRPVNLLG